MQLIGQKNRGASGTKSIRSNSNFGTRYTAQVEYYVLGTSVESATDAENCPGVPRLYQFVNNLYCVQVAATEQTITADGVLWTVLCKFDSQLSFQEGESEIWWDVEEKDEVLKYDAVDGTAITNSADEPITTTAPLSIPVLNVRRLEPSFSALRILRYNNHVNTNIFLGAPPYTVRCIGPVARPKKINEVYMWDVLYRFKFNMRIDPQTKQIAGWRLFLLDHGSRYIFEYVENPDDPDGAAIPVYKTIVNDEDQEETTKNLDGQGGILSDNAPEVFLEYNRYPTRDLDELGLFPSGANSSGEVL